MTQDLVFKLSDDDQQSLEKLALLINSVKNDFTDREIHLDKLNPKQTLLVAMFSAVNSYVEAIFELCKQGRTEAAIVIMRSLIEAYVNSNYILSYPSNKNLYLFAMEDSYYRRSLVDILNDFFARYPQRDRQELTVEQLKKMRAIPEKELRDYEENLNMHFEKKKDFDRAFGTLLDRAKEVDQRQKKRQKKSAGAIENVYILVYKYFSEYAHLSMRGIQHFWIKDSDGNTLIIDRNPDNIDLVLPTVFIMYLYFADRLKQRGFIKIPLYKFEKMMKSWPAPKIQTQT